MQSLPPWAWKGIIRRHKRVTKHNWLHFNWTLEKKNCLATAWGFSPESRKITASHLPIWFLHRLSINCNCRVDKVLKYLLGKKLTKLYGNHFFRNLTQLHEVMQFSANLFQTWLTESILYYVYFESNFKVMHRKKSWILEYQGEVIYGTRVFKLGLLDCKNCLTKDLSLSLSSRVFLAFFTFSYLMQKLLTR